MCYLLDFHSWRPTQVCCVCMCRHASVPVCLWCTVAEVRELISDCCCCPTCLLHTATSSAQSDVLSPPPGQIPTWPYFLSASLLSYFSSCLSSFLFSFLLHFLSPFLPHCTTSVFHSLYLLYYSYGFLFTYLIFFRTACLFLSLRFLFFILCHSFHAHNYSENMCPWTQETFSLSMGFCLCILPP